MQKGIPVRRFVLLAAGLFCLAFLLAPPTRAETGASANLSGAVGVLSSGAPAGYVGSAACANCHAAQSKAWAGSHHAKAMAVADEQNVLGDFSGQSIENAGSHGRFFKQDGKFRVETEGADGKLQVFTVSHTFGLAPLQQYLVTFPDGRVQTLPWAWDTRPKDKGGQRWFHAYGDQPIPPGDVLHWTGRQQTWNYMCAECHSTALHKGYDAEANSYHTTFSEISIGCESCHGPGADHLKWAQKPDDAPLKGFAHAAARRALADWTPDPATGSPAKGAARPSGDEVELCARCHSRRGALSEDWKPGAPLADTHMSAYLTRGLFEADGQMLDEVFNDQSFKQSRMYAKGVVCSDCHDPHSGQLKAAGAEVCAQCHAPRKFAVAQHTGHPAGPKSPDCISCHMPARTYMVVDRRHDHSFRIPRPDLTVKIGAPNTCNACHADKSAQWAADAITRWHGPEHKGLQTYAEAFQRARDGDPDSREALIALAKDPLVPGVARGAALVELASFPSSASAQAVADGLKDPDPVVRIAAARNLSAQPPEQKLGLAAGVLDDPVRGVRLEVGRALVDAPLDQATPAQRAAVAHLLEESLAILRLDEDRPEGRANLATFLMGQGKIAEAEDELRAGLRLDPRASELSANLADLYRRTQRDAQATQVLEGALALDPQNAALHHALGLALVRQKNYPQALEQLAQATQLAPDDARFAYVYGVALKSLGQKDQSVAVLQAALERHPYNAELLNAMLGEALGKGDVANAAPLAQRLAKVNPDDPRIAQLAKKLSGQ